LPLDARANRRQLLFAPCVRGLAGHGGNLPAGPSTQTAPTSTPTRRAWRCEQSWPHSPTGPRLANRTS
jgi:hypothetical protein